MILPFQCKEKYIIPTTFQQSELFFQTYFWGMDNRGKQKTSARGVLLMQRTSSRTFMGQTKVTRLYCPTWPLPPISFFAVSTCVPLAITYLGVWESLPMILRECSLFISSKGSQNFLPDGKCNTGLQAPASPLT